MHDQILEKIRKLLKLSEGAKQIGSVHEAANAAAIAQALLFEHKLSLADVPLGEVPAEEPVGAHTVPFDAYGKRVIRWRLNLLSGIARQNFCKIAWFNQRFNTCNILGRADSVQTVRYLFAFLSVEIDRLALNDLKTRALNKGDAKAWANNFRLGAVEAIENKMRDANKARAQAATVDHAAGNGKALMVIDREKQAVEAFYARITNGVKLSRRSSQSSYNHDARSAGREAGGNINLNSQISGRSARLLGK